MLSTIRLRQWPNKLGYDVPSHRSIMHVMADPMPSQAVYVVFNDPKRESVMFPHGTPVLEAVARVLGYDPAQHDLFYRKA